MKKALAIATLVCLSLFISHSIVLALSLLGVNPIAEKGEVRPREIPVKEDHVFLDEHDTEMDYGVPHDTTVPLWTGFNAGIVVEETSVIAQLPDSASVAPSRIRRPAIASSSQRETGVARLPQRPIAEKEAPPAAPEPPVLLSAPKATEEERADPIVEDDAPLSSGIDLDLLLAPQGRYAR